MTPSQTASPTPPPPRLAVRRGSIPAYSRRRDSRFADTPSPSPLERLIKRGGRCSRVTVLPTARPAASCPAAQRWRRLVLGMVQWRPPSYRPPRPGGQVITAECTTHHCSHAAKLSLPPGQVEDLEADYDGEEQEVRRPLRRRHLRCQPGIMILKTPTACVAA